jgi:hypothetical protein
VAKTTLRGIYLALHYLFHGPTHRGGGSPPEAMQQIPSPERAAV